MPASRPSSFSAEILSPTPHHPPHKGEKDEGGTEGGVVEMIMFFDQHRSFPIWLMKWRLGRHLKDNQQIKVKTQ